MKERNRKRNAVRHASPCLTGRRKKFIGKLPPGSFQVFAAMKQRERARLAASADSIRAPSQDAPPGSGAPASAYRLPTCAADTRLDTVLTPEPLENRT